MPKYYLLDENKNLVEGFDKEGFLTILEQAIENGSLENIDENSAVASKIKSVLNGTTHNIEFVTEAQYNQLVADGKVQANTYYFITDDRTAELIEEHYEEIEQSFEEILTKIATNEANIYELQNRNYLPLVTSIGFIDGKVRHTNYTVASYENVSGSYLYDIRNLDYGIYNFTVYADNGAVEVNFIMTYENGGRNRQRFIVASRTSPTVFYRIEATFTSPSGYGEGSITLTVYKIEFNTTVTVTPTIETIEYLNQYQTIIQKDVVTGITSASATTQANTTMITEGAWTVTQLISFGKTYNSLNN